MSETPDEKPAEKPPEPAAPAPAPEPPAAAPVAETPAPEPEQPEAPEEKPARPEPTLMQKLDFPLTLVTLVAAIVLLTWIQFSTQELIDHDSLYHVQAAHQLALTGQNIVLKRLYPWMQATFLRDHYADKEFLFHALLIPFCSDGSSMDANAKVATVLLGALVLSAFVLVLRGAGIRHAWLWLILLIGAGENSLLRLVETRPHLLSVALVLLGIRFLLRKQSLPLYFVGFVLAWSYSGPQVLPALALVAVLARWARDEELLWKPLLASVVGVTGGLLLNPFVPNNLYLWRVQNIEVLERAWGLKPSLARLGAELGAFDTHALVLGSPGLLLAFGLGVGAVLLARRRPSVRTVQLGALALASLLALGLTAKFLDYAAPLAVLFAASAVDDQWRTGEPSLKRSNLALILTVIALYLAGWAGFRVQRIAEKRFGHPPQLRGAARWLAANAQGTTVVHFDWNDFSTLFHDAPTSFYLFGLDPTFAEVYHPDVVEYLEAIRRGTKPVSGRWFAEADFSPRAQYLVVKQNTPEASACLSASLRIVNEDDGAIVFALTD